MDIVLWSHEGSAGMAVGKRADPAINQERCWAGTLLNKCWMMEKVAVYSNARHLWFVCLCMNEWNSGPTVPLPFCFPFEVSYGNPRPECLAARHFLIFPPDQSSDIQVLGSFTQITFQRPDCFIWLDFNEGMRHFPTLSYTRSSQPVLLGCLTDCCVA